MLDCHIFPAAEAAADETILDDDFIFRQSRLIRRRRSAEILAFSEIASISLSEIREIAEISFFRFFSDSRRFRRCRFRRGYPD